MASLSTCHLELIVLDNNLVKSFHDVRAIDEDLVSRGPRGSVEGGECGGGKGEGGRGSWGRVEEGKVGRVVGHFSSWQNNLSMLRYIIT